MSGRLKVLEIGAVVLFAALAIYAVAAAPDWSILGVMLYVPDIPLGFGVIVSILALVAAYKFTVWYPERVRSQLDR